MNVWHIPFNVIEDEWTDDQFFMMVERLGDRIKRENRNQKSGGAGRDGSSESNSATSRKQVSTAQLIELSKQEG
jgi:hypothetical protein